mgnify:CR=1 FL=1
MGLEIWIFFFQTEDGIRDLVRSRGLGDVYKGRAMFNDLFAFNCHMLLEPSGSARYIASS